MDRPALGRMETAAVAPTILDEKGHLLAAGLIRIRMLDLLGPAIPIKEAMVAAATAAAMAAAMEEVTVVTEEGMVVVWEVAMEAMATVVDLVAGMVCRLQVVYSVAHFSVDCCSEWNFSNGRGFDDLEGVRESQAWRQQIALL